MKRKIGSSEWHKEYKRNAENPMNAWKEDWSFEIKLLFKCGFILALGLILSWLMHPFAINELIESKSSSLVLAILGVCLFPLVLILMRRTITHTDYKGRTDYLEYLKRKK